MEKTFEEKFGLKTKEMENILGGVEEGGVTREDADANATVNICSFCTTCVGCITTCLACTTCVGCQSTFADVIPLE